MPKAEYYPAHLRGLTQTAWLRGWHSFSFGNYYDPNRLNFGTLRVLNDDTIAPGRGFPLHPHDNMEIVTIVLRGELEHRDTLGNQGVLRAGDVQRMTAGKGIKHSEVNASKTDSLHLLQIWILPERENLEPGYEQKNFSQELLKNRFCTLVANTKSDEALFIHQDVRFSMGVWDEPASVKYKLAATSHGLFVFVIEGEAKVEGKRLKTGDALAISEATEIELHPSAGVKILLIEVSI